ncbi:hypothetical protein DXG01_003834 [Tephrocybe rancida]|nr:hypothetical protein DXG01_003834 [Tephrocybe rancida]
MHIEIDVLAARELFADGLSQAEDEKGSVLNTSKKESDLDGEADTASKEGKRTLEGMRMNGNLWSSLNSPMESMTIYLLPEGLYFLCLRIRIQPHPNSTFVPEPFDTKPHPPDTKLQPYEISRSSACSSKPYHLSHFSIPLYSHPLYDPARRVVLILQYSPNADFKFLRLRLRQAHGVPHLLLEPNPDIQYPPSFHQG